MSSAPALSLVGVMLMLLILLRQGPRCVLDVEPPMMGQRVGLAPRPTPAPATTYTNPYTADSHIYVTYACTYDTYNTYTHTTDNHTCTAYTYTCIACTYT